MKSLTYNQKKWAMTGCLLLALGFNLSLHNAGDIPVITVDLASVRDPATEAKETAKPEVKEENKSTTKKPAKPKVKKGEATKAKPQAKKEAVPFVVVETKEEKASDKIFKGKVKLKDKEVTVYLEKDPSDSKRTLVTSTEGSFCENCSSTVILNRQLTDDNFALLTSALEKHFNKDNIEVVEYSKSKMRKISDESRTEEEEEDSELSEDDVRIANTEKWLSAVERSCGKKDLALDCYARELKSFHRKFDSSKLDKDTVAAFYQDKVTPLIDSRLDKIRQDAYDALSNNDRMAMREASNDRQKTLVSLRNMMQSIPRAMEDIRSDLITFQKSLIDDEAQEVRQASIDAQNLKAMASQRQEQAKQLQAQNNFPAAQQALHDSMQMNQEALMKESEIQQKKLIFGDLSSSLDTKNREAFKYLTTDTNGKDLVDQTVMMSMMNSFQQYVTEQTKLLGVQATLNQPTTNTGGTISGGRVGNGTSVNQTAGSLEQQYKAIDNILNVNPSAGGVSFGTETPVTPEQLSAAQRARQSIRGTTAFPNSRSAGFRQ